MKLIIVESPSKAKAINEYLKNEKEKYFTLSSMGHIRNLAKKPGSVDVEKNFEYAWEFTPNWKKVKKDILENAKKAEKIIIASDPDREGEAICWHLIEVFKKQKITAPIERIVFHSISKSSIKEALANTISMRTGLVESYLSRIGLDYLFGFSISPLLWHKIPCCKSAGRVQSPALKMLVEKENEIKNFISKPYETIHANFEKLPINSLLTQLNEEKFEKGMIFDTKIDIDKLKGNYFIQNIKKTNTNSTPPAPFITATLLQAASSELNFSPKQTMQIAQKLYEGFDINGTHTGLITYMRTDSFNIVESEIKKIRSKIENQFGKEYLSPTTVLHSQKIKNAQEAHEAIRPTNIELSPEKILFTDENLKKLYKIIWNRTLASQASNAIIENTNIILESELNNVYKKSIFETKISNTVFLGYKFILKDTTEEIIQLPELYANENLKLLNLEKKEHETKPPKRYSEASLIQLLKKQGIGRPSTYPNIISTLYDRDYAVKDKKIIKPTQKGWIVTSFLKSFFPEEISYEFTSKLEEKLDDLANSNETHLTVIKNFWQQLKEKIEISKAKAPLEVVKEIEDQFQNYFLANETSCSKCNEKMVLKVSRFGAIRGCSNYPNCKNIVNIDQIEKAEEKIIKTSKQEAILKIGPYGPYLATETKKIPIPKIWHNEIEDFPIEKAEFLLELPKKLGKFEEKDVFINIGRFGPYVQIEKTFASVKNPLEITLEAAIAAILAKTSKKKT